ncbi:MAG: peptidylprolyl isomerase [Planctomycetota bacterium]
MNNTLIRSTLVMLLALVALWAVVQADPVADSAQEAPKKESSVPETYKVLFETSCGNFTVQVTRAWAPLGADRFHELVTAGYFNGSGFFRVVTGFVVQFGLAADPKVTAKWVEARLKDDPVKQTNSRGRLTFATAGPNTRTTQLFINLGNNEALDGMGFSPFGEVVEGMDVVDKINKEYGEKPRQDLITSQGAEYLSKEFPKLDLIKSAKILPQ